MRIRSFADAVAWLDGRIGRGKKRGLENMRRVMAALGDPHRAHPVVHVTGTNGKGSCASFLASILDAAGLRAGLFTSPHLSTPAERICVGRAPVGRRAFTRAVAEVAAACEALAVSPIYFEATAMTAMRALADAKVDVAVLEVGVGGRLDATNVVEPEVTLITELGFDHEAYLGPTLEAIATEKLGIVKPGCDFVTGVADPALRRFVLEGARARGAVSATAIDDLPFTAAPAVGAGERLRVEEPRFGPLDLRLRMTGSHQARNALCALLAASRLARRGFPVDAGAVSAGLSRAVWPARFETLSRDPLLVIDGCHNESGASTIAATVRDRLAGRPLTLVFGIFRDKRVTGVAERLARAASRVVTTTAPDGRAADPYELKSLFEALGVPAEAVPDPAGAVTRALETLPAGGACLVAGSIYLAGLVRARFCRRRFKPF